jgi:hypothetical protein
MLGMKNGASFWVLGALEVLSKEKRDFSKIEVDEQCIDQSLFIVDWSTVVYCVDCTTLIDHYSGTVLGRLGVIDRPWGRMPKIAF